ncbi:hypothetical protein BSSX_p0109 (plasmid) [Bacillus subtilis]|nr:hypothetical protein BSSX_p0109 [Bacillus subtilis]
MLKRFFSRFFKKKSMASVWQTVWQTYGKNRNHGYRVLLGSA